MVAKSESKKTWNYAKDGCTLDFTLRVDIKLQLKAYIEMLERAAADLKVELTKVK